MPITVIPITRLKKLVFKDGTVIEVDGLEANLLNLKFVITDDKITLMQGFGDYAELEGRELIEFKRRRK